MIGLCDSLSLSIQASFPLLFSLGTPGVTAFRLRGIPCILAVWTFLPDVIGARIRIPKYKMYYIKQNYPCKTESIPVVSVYEVRFGRHYGVFFFFWCSLCQRRTSTKQGDFSPVFFFPYLGAYTYTDSDTGLNALENSADGFRGSSI